MSCLWPNTKDGVRLPNSAGRTGELRGGVSLWLPRATIVVLTVLYGLEAWSSSGRPFRVNLHHDSLAQSERKLRHAPAHVAEFAPISALAFPSCESLRPPEALLTPDPTLPAGNDSLPVRVSFIIGSDGHVHSAFVLYSGGPVEDAVVLRAVRKWRYRPALCNGVPTDSEARVRFSVRE